MEAAVLHRVGISAYFCHKEDQDFKPSAAPLYPNMSQVSPRGDARFLGYFHFSFLTVLSTTLFTIIISPKNKYQREALISKLIFN